MESRIGFIHDKLDIKILILFILLRLPEAITLEQLAELTLCDEGINYFDFSECVADLIKTEHIAVIEGKYDLTDKGRTNGKITESSIPYSVRLKAERGASVLKRSLNRNAMINTAHKQRKAGGFTVSLSMADGIDKIISMELLAGSESQANTLEQNFRKNAEEIYNKIISLLLEE